MTELPILFSAPMVRAILDGRKTQTRRTCNPRDMGSLLGLDASDPACWGYIGPDGAHHPLPMRYGSPGDRLWVRETHGWLTGNGRRTVYRADADPPLRTDGSAIDGMRWRPSIFMRRSESRITLAVESVRVERLQAITEADARAEGVTVEDGVETYRDAYERLWGEINGPESWAANPWVWVVTFSRVQP